MVLQLDKSHACSLVDPACEQTHVQQDLLSQLAKRAMHKEVKRQHKRANSDVAYSIIEIWR